MRPRPLIAATAIAVAAALAPAIAAQASAAHGSWSGPSDSSAAPSTSDGTDHHDADHADHHSADHRGVHHHGIQRRGTQHHRKSHGGKLSEQDETWFATSAAGDVFEIQSGRIAEKRAAFAATRVYAARLVADHTKSYQEKQALGAKLHLGVPAKPTQDMLDELERIAALHGRGFDIAFLRTEVGSHRRIIADTRAEVTRGSHRLIVHRATMEMPVLKLHLYLGKKTLRIVTHHA